MAAVVATRAGTLTWATLQARAVVPVDTAAMAAQGRPTLPWLQLVAAELVVVAWTRQRLAAAVAVWGCLGRAPVVLPGP
jgi:hypothetical protein